MQRGSSLGESRNDRTAVLLDPHPIWLDAVASVLERAGVTAVGKATSSSAALSLLAKHRPDLLVTETRVEAGVAEGLACIREARLDNPALHVVVLAASDLPVDIDDALAAGVAAYVVKSAHPDDLASAVRQAFSHSVYFAGGSSSTPPTRTWVPAAPSRDEGTGLTKRELEILRLAAEGHSNAQLARMLWVTEQTVKFHLSNVYRKLDVSNRTEAARWAQLNGMLGPAAQAPERDAA
jgi:DNA-binding NarL/FixJ family response regulator